MCQQQPPRGKFNDELTAAAYSGILKEGEALNKLVSLCDQYVGQGDFCQFELSAWRLRIQKDSQDLFTAKKTFKVWQQRGYADPNELAATWCGYTFLWVISQLSAGASKERIYRAYSKQLKEFVKAKNDIKQRQSFLSMDSTHHSRQLPFVTVNPGVHGIESQTPIVFQFGMDFVESELYYALVDAQGRGGILPQVTLPPEGNKTPAKAPAQSLPKSCLRKSRKWNCRSSRVESKTRTAAGRRFSFCGFPATVEDGRRGLQRSMSSQDLRQEASSRRAVRFEEYTQLKTIPSKDDYSPDAKTLLWLPRDEIVLNIHCALAQQWKDKSLVVKLAEKFSSPLQLLAIAA